MFLTKQFPSNTDSQSFRHSSTNEILQTILYPVFLCFLWFLLHQPKHHPLRSHITENPPADWLATQQLHWDLHDKKTSHWPMPLALLGFSIPAPLLASFRLPNPWTSSFFSFSEGGIKMYQDVPRCSKMPSTADAHSWIFCVLMFWKVRFDS